MYSRTRIAIELAMLLTLITSITALAKGGFSFITITGPSLKEAVRVTDLALINDFFAFADFFQDKTEAPASPGAGYEITRYYIDNNRDVAFDRLHYYPETGFVYYNGIVNGSSEYDGEWYTAKPEIKTAFENVLFKQTQVVAPIAEPQSIKSIDPIRPGISITQSQIIMLIAITAGLAVVFGRALWRRRTSAQ